MVVRYPALPTQLASTSSASRSARRSPAPLANHGKYTDDHWPVDELLALARGERTTR